MSLINRSLTAVTGYEPLPKDVDNRKFLLFTMMFQSWAKFFFKPIAWLGWADVDLPVLRLAFPAPKFGNIKDTSISYGIKISQAEFNGVRVRIYESLAHADKTNKPAIVYYHGGGWFIASAAGFDWVVTYIVKKLQVVAISVDYRLAPENAFPVPVDDCYQATRYVLEHGQEMGIDPARIAIFGDSAGGHLAAAVALKIRDEKLEQRPKLQILINPMTQGVTFNFPSYQRHFTALVNKAAVAKCYVFANEKMAKCKSIKDTVKKLTLDKHMSPISKVHIESLYHLLPEEYKEGFEAPENYGTDRELQRSMEAFVLDPYVSPLLANDLSDLPEAYVWIAGYDVLRDEGTLYAKRLQQAGNTVTMVTKATAPHGGWIFPAASNYKQETFEYIKQRL